MSVTGKLEPLKENINIVSTEFIDMVDERLQSLNYTIQDIDAMSIVFAIQKVTNKIQNECNTKNIPGCLTHIAVDMVCGEFLLAKKGFGQLEGFEIDIETVAVKQVQEGDTNIVFAIGSGSLTPEQRLDSVIHHLVNNGRNEFIRHRKIVW